MHEHLDGGGNVSACACVQLGGLWALVLSMFAYHALVCVEAVHAKTLAIAAAETAAVSTKKNSKEEKILAKACQDLVTFKQRNKRTILVNTRTGLEASKQWIMKNTVAHESGGRAYSGTKQARWVFAFHLVIHEDDKKLTMQIADGPMRPCRCIKLTHHESGQKKVAAEEAGGNALYEYFKQYDIASDAGSDAGACTEAAEVNVLEEENAFGAQAEEPVVDEGVVEAVGTLC